jgi:2-oxoglutarate dehydrogenase E1 component
MSSDRDSMLQGANTLYLEEMIRQYHVDPSSVDASWREFFEGPGRDYLEGFVPTDGPSFKPASVFNPGHSNGPKLQGREELLHAQVRIGQLIDAYRMLGHRKAELDPLRLTVKKTPKVLSAQHWGFTEADYNRTFSAVGLYGGPSSMKLGDVIDWLDDTYARTIGVEYQHINDESIVTWLEARLEANRNHRNLDRETQHFILERLSIAEAFEDFLHKKFRGAKRFSLEGGESLIPMLALLIEEFGEAGVSVVVMGMAHRGRLNVLANIMEKSYSEIFSEFEDVNPEEHIGRGDVKYHKGHSADVTTRLGDKMHLSLAFNPSHLEFINPVVMGRTKAKQDRRHDTDGSQVAAILIHGDAAFSGQGIVTETLNLMRLDGYSTGGTIHIVVNNQIGFTTNPEESRSSTYCTDVAKMVEVPIFHVNAEDPEAVAQVVSIAAEFRQIFKRDVIIDLTCFRRYGHNEADEPKFTQPEMYAKIDAHPPVHEVYAERLLTNGLIAREDVDAIWKGANSRLEQALSLVRGVRQDAANATKPNGHVNKGVWTQYVGGRDVDCPIVATNVSEARLKKVARHLIELPGGFTANRKVAKLLKKRHDAVSSGGTIDWGTAELLAYGSLLQDGHAVRISGQDCQRGTFSHRHAVLTDQVTGERYAPLQPLETPSTRFTVLNSSLSEAGVLGFEFGYGMDSPEALVIWEAQFGDFANGAQVIIDQFLTSSEDKWNRLSGVTLLLPHGYEGQGPEHSSARFERYLTACAEDNIQVVNATTPAQIFHCLRRQVVRIWRKPLVVMSPKSLLRHKRAVSPLKEFTDGNFQRVIPDNDVDAKKVERVIFCTGKVYYELLDRREQLGDEKSAIVRIEQLYPIEAENVKAAYASFDNLKEIVWCQEEPENMGAFQFLFPRFTRWFADRSVPLRWVSRAASASPATGSGKAHKIEQENLLASVFND